MLYDSSSKFPEKKLELLYDITLSNNEEFDFPFKELLKTNKIILKNPFIANIPSAKILNWPTTQASKKASKILKNIVGSTSMHITIGNKLTLLITFFFCVEIFTVFILYWIFTQITTLHKIHPIEGINIRQLFQMNPAVVLSKSQIWSVVE